MNVQLSEEELKIVNLALGERVDGLRRYKSFLHTEDGQKLAGAYTAIGQVDQDIRSTKLLHLRMQMALLDAKKESV